MIPAHHPLSTALYPEASPEGLPSGLEGPVSTFPINAFNGKDLRGMYLWIPHQMKRCSGSQEATALRVQCRQSSPGAADTQTGPEPAGSYGGTFLLQPPRWPCCFQAPAFTVHHLQREPGRGRLRAAGSGDSQPRGPEDARLVCELVRVPTCVLGDRTQAGHCTDRVRPGQLWVWS